MGQVADLICIQRDLNYRAMGVAPIFHTKRVCTGVFTGQIFWIRPLPTHITQGAILRSKVDLSIKPLERFKNVLVNNILHCYNSSGGNFGGQRRTGFARSHFFG